MSDIRKLLDIISESTVAGAVASVPAASAPVQKRMEETAKETTSPGVLEYGMWENSALATTGKLKKTRQKSAKIVKSIYGESTRHSRKNIAESAEIVALQQKLNALGANLEVDGIMGTKTQEAMRKYMSTTQRSDTTSTTAATTTQKPTQAPTVSMTQRSDTTSTTAATTTQKPTQAPTVSITDDRPAVKGPSTDKEIKAVVNAGPGWTAVKASDGELQLRDGNRNWRNNNPGNLAYTPWSKRHGAIGTDGTYAVFPTLQIGAQAKKDLLFASDSKYKNLSIAQAMEKYAPRKENNTDSYIREIVNATQATEDTLIKNLTPAQQDAMLAAIKRREGFVVGKIYAIANQPEQNQTVAETAYDRPRIRKYTKERPNGTKMERWEVLDKAGKRVKEFDSKELAQKYLKDNKFDLMYESVAKGYDDRKTAPGWHSDSVKNPNFNDELSGRRVSPPGKRLKSGKLSADERGSQERTKALMKFKHEKGGLTGPKGPLPEEQGVAEGGNKLQGTPVVSLKDFDDKDTKKDRYGRTVPKKLKKDDPRVKFHKEPEKQDVEEDQLDEVNWKNAVASGAMALSALGGAANAQAADEPVQQTTATTVQQAPQQKRDLSSFSSEYLQKASNPNGGRYMVSPEEAKAELQARANGTSQQKPATAPSVQKSSGYSKEYLQSVVNGTHPRPMISIERAQELLNQMQVNEAEISEEQLLTAKLKKELELLKKEKSKEISSKPTDKEIQRKK